LDGFYDLHRDLMEIVVARVALPVWEFDEVSRCGMDVLVTQYRSNLAVLFRVEPGHDFALRRVGFGSAGTTRAPDSE
jgi:hypothetical protein